MKRNLSPVRSLLLAVALGATALAGCSSSSDSTRPITASTETDGSPAESGVDAATGTDTSDNGSVSDASASVPDTTIPEQVILDANDVRITAVEYTTDSIWGDGIKLLIENNGTDSIGVGCDALIVNDYMISDLFSSQVAAGKKSNEVVYLSTSSLKAAGIDIIGKIEMQLHLYDPDTYMSTYTSDMITLQTNHYNEMDTTPNDEGQELYNDGGIRIVGKYVDENSFWGNAIVLYLENNTSQNICVQCDDMSVNGYMVTPYFSSTVYSEKKAIDEITLMQSDLDDNGITSVDDVELTFRIINPDNYMDISETGPITFSTK